MSQFSSRLLILTCLVAAAGCAPPSIETLEVRSPDESIAVNFFLEDGTPFYRVERNGREVVGRSRLGFQFKTGGSLARGLKIFESTRSSVDQTWEQPWGEAQFIRDHHNELRVTLEEFGDPKRWMTIIFRAFDDGLGFRYELPEQKDLEEVEIIDELTEFRLPAVREAWWIPAYRDNRYEYLYQRTPLQDIEVVHTPLTMTTTDGLFLSIHEAALTDYASMTLRNTGDSTLQADLVPWSDGVRVRGKTPLVTPWRTIQIASSPSDLITSYLVLNLNEPNRLGDVSWVKPAKYVGIWWGMHIGKLTWGSGPDHGATTERTKEYIDFAAANGFRGVLVEGWNVGWDGNWMANGEIFSFTTPYPDFDIEELSRYAAEKGVKIIGHHETAAAIDNYERQMEDAFAYYKRLGIDTVKTGYVGTRANRTEWHHGQYMVRHYRKVVETAARYGIMLDVHEPIKDTGIRRTYPNMMTREGARGMEYDAWSADGGNPPEHAAILPFTRLLAGPMDYTPGVFDLFFEETKPNNRVNTTIAKQLALYVVIYSPLQMAADLPENYVDQPAFQFIRDVPVDWSETRVLNGQIGDFVTIVRRDRNSENWYLGSVTDEDARSFSVPLDFLPPGQKYRAEIYADGPAADWKTNPRSISISSQEVDSSSVLEVTLAAGGGQAIRFVATHE